jgi:DNA-binding CsgD family transcriptional regulator
MKFWQRARRWLYVRIARTVWGEEPDEMVAPADAGDGSPELPPLWEHPPGEALEWEFRRRWAALTLRERQVLRLYLAHSEDEFLSAYQLARRLGITRSTLRTHLHRAYRKLGIHSRRELVDLRELIEGRGSQTG